MRIGGERAAREEKQGERENAARRVVNLSGNVCHWAGRSDG
jgi:hypothetical protein